MPVRSLPTRVPSQRRPVGWLWAALAVLMLVLSSCTLPMQDDPANPGEPVQQGEPPAAAWNGTAVPADRLTAGPDGHTCVITDLGSLWCWGANTSGQLGDGTTVRSTVPVQVVRQLTGLRQVDVSNGRTCAIGDGGVPQCWGRADLTAAMLKAGVTAADLPLRYPTDVAGVDPGIRNFAVAPEFTCALTAASAVTCWGGMSETDLLGTPLARVSSTPIVVTGLASRVVALEANGRHACALASKGAVRCWGTNEYGELGKPSASLDGAPVTATGLLKGVVAIATGREFTCALTSAGGVLCWGRNDRGQLGSGSIAGPGVATPEPTPVSGLSADVQTITAGEDHACALTSERTVQCWGANSRGQLGDGTVVGSAVPVQVTGLPEDVIAISAGNAYTCALTRTSEVWCWGANDTGQLGNRSTTDAKTPTKVLGLPSKALTELSTSTPPTN